MSEQDDLTTDAIPSPPRDEIKNEINKEFEEHINSHPKTKTKKTGKRTIKHSSPTAIASVINISNATGIHIGSNYTLYVNKTENTTLKKDDHAVTDAIKALFESTEPVEHKHLNFLSSHINETWRDTARQLDFSDGQISQFYEDYNRMGIKEVIYQILLDWIQNEADAATVGRLSKVLWETSQQDAVKRWSKYFTK